MKTIVSVSGGLSSAEMLRRAIEKEGKENVIAVFADVKGNPKSHKFFSPMPDIDLLLHERFGGEARDLYRFLWFLSYELDVPIMRLDQFNTIYANMAKWRAFILKNPSGINFAPCSLYGKREKIADYILNNFTQGEYQIALGFDVFEIGRLKNAQRWWQNRLGWEVSVICPLMEKPYATNESISRWLNEKQIPLPSAYCLGFEHNNCNGGCVQAGIKHFVLLHETRPEVFYYWAYMEECLRGYIGTEATILRFQSKGIKYRMSLFELGERIINNNVPNRWTTLAQSAGCSCFSIG